MEGIGFAIRAVSKAKIMDKLIRDDRVITGFYWYPGGREIAPLREAVV